MAANGVGDGEVANRRLRAAKAMVEQRTAASGDYKSAFDWHRRTPTHTHAYMYIQSNCCLFLLL